MYVLFFFSDKSMEILFKNGEGPVFYEMIKWLDSDIDHLKLSGALAVGNFARNGILFFNIFPTKCYLISLRNIIHVLDYT